MTTFCPAAIGHAVEFGVALGRAAHVDDGADPAQQFFDRAREPRVEIGAQPRQLLGMLEERVHSAGDEIPGRVTARVDEQQEEQVEVDDVELAVVDARRRDERGEIVGGFGALALPHLARVVEHLHHRHHRRARFLRFGRRVDLLGEAVELDAVFERDAEHVGDDVRRHESGDVGDEIALAARGDAVDDAARRAPRCGVASLSPPEG